MATVAEQLTPLSSSETSKLLADQWRRLRRAATFVALLTSPALFVWFHQLQGWSVLWSLVASFLCVIAFRGVVDLVFKRTIPWPSLFGSDSVHLREEDVVNRRRAWFWRFWLRIAVWVSGLVTIVWLFRGGTWLGTVSWFLDRAGYLMSQPTLWIQVVFVFFLFIANFAILLGPLLAMNITQIRGYEPGDAEWGVKLADVRG